MEKENAVEMSVLDELIPRYHNGFDMDDVIRRLFNNEFVSEEEKKALGKAQNIYHTKHFDENRKRYEKCKKWEKEHPGEYRRTITLNVKRKDIHI